MLAMLSIVMTRDWRWRQHRRPHRTIGRSRRHLHFPAGVRQGRESRRQIAEKDGAGETEEYDATSGGLWRGMRGRGVWSPGSRARQQIFWNSEIDCRLAFPEHELRSGERVPERRSDRRPDNGVFTVEGFTRACPDFELCVQGEE